MALPHREPEPGAEGTGRGVTGSLSPVRAGNARWRQPLVPDVKASAGFPRGGGARTGTERRRSRLRAETPTGARGSRPLGARRAGAGARGAGPRARARGRGRRRRVRPSLCARLLAPRAEVGVCSVCFSFPPTGFGCLAASQAPGNPGGKLVCEAETRAVFPAGSEGSGRGRRGAAGPAPSQSAGGAGALRWASPGPGPSAGRRRGGDRPPTGTRQIDFVWKRHLAQ